MGIGATEERVERIRGISDSGSTRRSQRCSESSILSCSTKGKQEAAGSSPVSSTNEEEIQVTISRFSGMSCNKGVISDGSVSRPSAGTGQNRRKGKK